MKKKFINVDGKKFYITELSYTNQTIYDHSFSTDNYNHDISIQSEDNHTNWVVTVAICQKDRSDAMTQHYFNVGHHKKRSQVIREALNKAYEYVSGSVYKDDVEHYKPTKEAKIHYTEPCTLLETIANYHYYEGKPNLRIHNKEEPRHTAYKFCGLNKAIEHRLIDADDLGFSDWVCSWEE